jgi:hypothetical protein
MPKSKPNDTRPPVFGVTRRIKMGADAKNQPLSTEEPLSSCPGKPFASEKEAKTWINTNGEGNYIYIIRDRYGKAHAQLTQRGNGSWVQVNAYGYYNEESGDTFTIGKPRTLHPCGCCRKLVCINEHPSKKAPQ